MTLVELLVVVAVIGMIVGLLLPAVHAAGESARLLVGEAYARQANITQPPDVEGVEPHAHRRHGPGTRQRLVHPQHGQRGKSDLQARVDSDTGGEIVITVRESGAKK